MNALRVGSLDRRRRRLRVSAAVVEVRGQLVEGTPKTHQQRAVPLPRFLIDELAAHVEGRSGDDLVFTTSAGAPLRNTNFRRRHWDKAVKASGLDGLTPHDLRHTAASLAVGAGANVKAVQQMLGHASAAMTLDVYAGLFYRGRRPVARAHAAAYVSPTRYRVPQPSPTRRRRRW
jgi:integrase